MAEDTYFLMSLSVIKHKLHTFGLRYGLMSPNKACIMVFTKQNLLHGIYKER